MGRGEGIGKNKDEGRKKGKEDGRGIKEKQDRREEGWREIWKEKISDEQKEKWKGTTSGMGSHRAQYATMNTHEHCYCTPSLALRNASSKKAIRPSAPSAPYLLTVPNFLAKKLSKTCDWRSSFASSSLLWGGVGVSRIFSNLSTSHSLAKPFCVHEQTRRHKVTIMKTTKRHYFS